jgi:hypothetical protein
VDIAAGAAAVANPGGGPEAAIDTARRRLALADAVPPPHQILDIPHHENLARLMNGRGMNLLNWSAVIRLMRLRLII